MMGGMIDDYVNLHSSPRDAQQGTQRKPGVRLLIVDDGIYPHFGIL